MRDFQDLQGFWYELYPQGLKGPEVQIELRARVLGVRLRVPMVAVVQIHACWWRITHWQNVLRGQFEIVEHDAVVDCASESQPLRT